MTDPNDATPPAAPSEAPAARSPLDAVHARIDAQDGKLNAILAALQSRPAPVEEPSPVVALKAAQSVLEGSDGTDEPTTHAGRAGVKIGMATRALNDAAAAVDVLKKDRKADPKRLQDAEREHRARRADLDAAKRGLVIARSLDQHEPTLDAINRGKRKPGDLSRSERNEMREHHLRLQGAAKLAPATFTDDEARHLKALDKLASLGHL